MILKPQTLVCGFLIAFKVNLGNIYDAFALKIKRRALILQVQIKFMIQEIITAMLWSISPFGEAKVGIPYGLVNGLNKYIVFIICFLANVLVFPLMLLFLDKINRHLLKWTFYKKTAISIARRAKIGSGNVIQKYGFFGLIFFVMLPVPGTGVYAGTIATYIFKIERRKAFLANTIGIFISSAIVWSTVVLAMKGAS